MELLRLLEGLRSPFFSAIFGLVTRLGEETVAIVVLCAIYWCINKQLAYGIGVAYFLSGLSVQCMKICFRIERPWVVDPTLNPVPSARGQATGYSFPSGHTQSAAALFGSLGAQTKQKPIKALCFLLVLLVAFSRMYLGVHTLLDVAISLLISLIFVFAAEKMRRCSRHAALAVFMIVYAIAVIVIAIAIYSGGKIEQGYLSDCLKAAGAGVGFAVGMYIERVYIDFSVDTKNIFWQVIKFAFGIAGLFVVKEGLKLVIGTGLIVDTMRYFLTILWVTLLFPLIIKHLFATLSKDRK